MQTWDQRKSCFECDCRPVVVPATLAAVSPATVSEAVPVARGGLVAVVSVSGSCLPVVSVSPSTPETEEEEGAVVAAAEIVVVVVVVVAEIVVVVV